MTRCPLVLKLKRDPHKAWRGRISYRKTELQFQDPSQVEKEIRQGRRPGFLQVRLRGRSLPVLASSLPPGPRASWSPPASLLPFLPGSSTGCSSCLAHCPLLREVPPAGLPAVLVTAVPLSRGPALESIKAHY